MDICTSAVNQVRSQSLYFQQILKKYSITYLIMASLLGTACGGSTTTTQPDKLVQVIDPMTMTGLNDNDLIGANDNVAIIAKSANLTKAVLLLNGEEISTINTAPFEFTSANITLLADLPIGHHKIELRGTVDGKEESLDISFKKDGEYLATYAAINYVYENSPYEKNSVTKINNIAFTAREGGWVDIAGDTAIEDTEFDSLYTRELADDNINLSHQVSDGTYIVEMHFAEIWFNGTTREGRGARIFDVVIEDSLVADNLDIFAEVGYLSAYTIKDEAVQINDSELNISLTSLVGEAKVNAYSIQRVLGAWNDEDNDGVDNFDDKCLGTSANAEVDQQGCALPPPVSEPNEEPVKINGGVFVEKDGLLVVEMESTDHSDGWEFETGRDATGAGYLNMLAPQAAWNPANIKEIIKVRIKIENSGRYQFAWRNLITKPEVPSTEHNDSYLKIKADKFYGQKAENIVCPKQLEPENKCVPAGRSLAGEAALGYFKIWRSGSPIDEWNWSTNTSDSDAHTVFAEFDSAGEYEVEIANRSDYHAIDRFVLFRDGNESNNVAKSLAQDLTTAESTREP